MGLTKQYLRYEAAGLFSIIGSPRAGIELLDKASGGRSSCCAVGACQHVIIWDLRKSEKVQTLYGDKHEVTALVKSPDDQHLAVGYSDGTVRIFDIGSGDCSVVFSGHKSAVTALNYDKDGMRLVSGSKDTEVIIWDIVNESGLYRLRGHKGQVTQARFLQGTNVLITSCKDTFVKFWDLDTQHCFKTLVGHRTEVWDFVVVRGERWLITGSADMELRVWQITYSKQEEEEAPVTAAAAVPKKKAKLGDSVASDDEMELSDGEEVDDDDSNILKCERIGSIQRQGRDRLVSMTTDPTGTILGCHGIDSTLEIFKILTEDEVKKQLQKREKKARKRARESGTAEGGVLAAMSIEDQLRRITKVKMASKLRAFQFRLENEQLCKVVCLLTNNTIQVATVDISKKKADADTVSQLSLPGHRSDVRTVSFSSDNTAFLSGSADMVKVWNRATMQCIRTVKCGYALCSLFAPGDRHVIIGTKSGRLQIFDLAAGVLLEDIGAHGGAVWSMALAPDKRSIVSGSADHEVKFWDFELISDEGDEKSSKRLSLVQTRTLKMAEDVLCVRFSPDHKLLAVSLLDNTVKVFFADTLKFFLSLYGHKLPVLCMDISSDSSLLVTGSADRNIKLWGLDFGDCHKSIFAHDDSIMCVQFVAKTHMFFTGGKDRKLKEWDGDSFEQIQTLEGHLGEVWCLAVSPSGNFLLSGSHDRSLRVWERSQEPLVLDEEKEMEREKEYDETVGQGAEPVIAGETNKEVAIAGKKTVETVKAAERLMEALELYKEESEKLAEHKAECKAVKKQLPTPPLHPLFQAYNVTSPDKYVLEVIKKIKSSELEESLLVLPFSYVTQLLSVLNIFVESGWEVELSCRCIFFLLRIHQGQITSNQVLLPVIDRLRTNTVSRVNEIRDTVGFNLAALKFIKQRVEEKEQVMFFADATEQLKEKKKKRKRAILAFKV